jgi:hypothetical protein
MADTGIRWERATPGKLVAENRQLLSEPERLAA